METNVMDSLNSSSEEPTGSDSDTMLNDSQKLNQSPAEHWADQILFFIDNPLKKHASEKSRLQSIYHAYSKIINQYNRIKKGQQTVMKIKSQQFDKIKNALKIQKLKLKKRMHTQKFKKFRDKIGFTFGVFNLIISTYLMGENVQWLYYWYSLSCFLTILIRFYRYTKKNEQYYYLDFCYVANIMIMLFFNFFRDNEVLFTIVFMFTMGPLLLAIPSFRNSLVFHSLDRLTSLKIHLAPAITLFSYRWKDKAVENIFKTQSFNFTYFARTLGKSFSIYLVWAIVHYIAIFWILKQKDLEKKYITSFDYLTKNPKNWKFKATFKFGNNLKVAGLIYIFLNICINFFTLAFAIIQFRFYYVNLFYLIFCIYISVWNGANFYIEYFSRKYDQSIKDFEAMYKRLDDQEFEKLFSRIKILNIIQQSNNLRVRLLRSKNNVIFKNKNVITIKVKENEILTPQKKEKLL